MALSTQEQILIEQKVTNEAKSTGVAYLLWVVLGGFGAHRFYLGRTGSAIGMVCLAVLGIVTSVVGVGLFLLLALGIWGIVDAFLIPGMVSAHKHQIRNNLTMAALTSGSGPAISLEAH